MKLRVTSQFGGYLIGDQIADPEIVQSVLAGENENCVVKVADDPPQQVRREKKAVEQ